MHGGCLSDQQDRRRLCLRRCLPELSQDAVHSLFIRHIDMGKNAHGRLRVHSRAHQSICDLAGLAVTHKKYERPLKPGQDLIGFRCPAGSVSCHNSERGGKSSMCDRYTHVLGSRDTRAHAGDHLIGNAGRLKSQRFLAAPAKYRGISPLEPDDLLPAPRPVDQELVNLLLLPFVEIFPLSGADQLAASLCLFKDRMVQKIVIHHDLRPAQGLKPPHCDQPGFAPRADDPHFSDHIIPHTIRVCPRASPASFLIHHEQFRAALTYFRVNPHR